MNLSAEIIWLFVGIVCLFFELFIPGLVIAFFGIGALITALTSWIGLTVTLVTQLLVFMISSILLLVILRKTLKETFLGKTKEGDDYQNFNVEIGKIIPVVELIQPNEVGGKVRYQGAPWSAMADEQIAPGESVKIIGCENLTLIVQKIKKNNGGGK